MDDILNEGSLIKIIHVNNKDTFTNLSYYMEMISYNSSENISSIEIEVSNIFIHIHIIYMFVI